jgi:uncharacterized membrane protein YbhN (UPF0104 family)
VTTAWIDGARRVGRRRRRAITVVVSLAAAAALVVLLAGRRDEFMTALSAVSAWVLAATVLLQIVALVARSEAWHLTIEAAGGTVDRRVLYRASSMQVLGSVVNGQLGVAARIAALRRSSPEVSPQVPTLIAAEFPILAVEAMLAALASFTLVGPLGLPWWLPIVGFAVVGAASAGLRHLAARKGRELWNGLAVLRSLNGGSRVIGLVLVAVFAQIFRTWLLLDGSGCGRRSADDRDRHRRRAVLRGMGRRRPALGRRPPRASIPRGVGWSSGHFTALAKATSRRAPLGDPSAGDLRRVSSPATEGPSSIEQLDAVTGHPRSGRPPRWKRNRRARHRRRSAESCANDISHAHAAPAKRRWRARKRCAGVAAPSGRPRMSRERR